MDGDYAHVFDCDGVILDSNNFKIECLNQSLNKSDFSLSDKKEILSFFKLNFGLTRDTHFDKFREIARQTENCYDAKFKRLRLLYDTIVLEDYSKCSLIIENTNYISHLANKNDVYVVSASDQTELRSFLPKKFKIIKEKNIFGGPTKKNIHLGYLKSKIEKNLIYYGDSVNDAQAAMENGILFYGLTKYSNSSEELINYCRKNNLKILETL